MADLTEAIARLEEKLADTEGACKGWCGAAFQRWRERAEKAEARVKELEAAPKKVWVLHYGNYYPREVGAICGTREAAERAKACGKPGNDLRIERWDVE